MMDCKENVPDRLILFDTYKTLYTANKKHKNTTDDNSDVLQFKENTKAYLNTHKFSEKFSLLDFMHLFLEALKLYVEHTDGNTFEDISLGFENLEKFGKNLMRTPWRREFYTIKLFTCFFKHSIESHVPFGTDVLALYGYTPKRNDVMVLQEPLDLDRIALVSFELFLASMEMKFMSSIAHELCDYSENTLMCIIKARWRNVGGKETVLSSIAKRYSLLPPKRIKLDHDGMVDKSGPSEGEPHNQYEKPHSTLHEKESEMVRNAREIRDSVGNEGLKSRELTDKYSTSKDGSGRDIIITGSQSYDHSNVYKYDKYLNGSERGSLESKGSESYDKRLYKASVGEPAYRTTRSNQEGILNQKQRMTYPLANVPGRDSSPKRYTMPADMGPTRGAFNDDHIYQTFTESITDEELYGEVSPADHNTLLSEKIASAGGVSRFVGSSEWRGQGSDIDYETLWDGGPAQILPPSKGLPPPEYSNSLGKDSIPPQQKVHDDWVVIENGVSDMNLGGQSRGVLYPGKAVPAVVQDQSQNATVRHWSDPYVLKPQQAQSTRSFSEVLRSDRTGQLSRVKSDPLSHSRKIADEFPRLPPKVTSDTYPPLQSVVVSSKNLADVSTAVPRSLKVHSSGKDGVCFLCSKPPSRECLHCSKLFCEEHANIFKGLSCPEARTRHQFVKKDVYNSVTYDQSRNVAVLDERHVPRDATATPLGTSRDIPTAVYSKESRSTSKDITLAVYLPNESGSSNRDIPTAVYSKESRSTSRDIPLAVYLPNESGSPNRDIPTAVYSKESRSTSRDIPLAVYLPNESGSPNRDIPTAVYSNSESGITSKSAVPKRNPTREFSTDPMYHNPSTKSPNAACEFCSLEAGKLMCDKCLKVCCRQCLQFFDKDLCENDKGAHHFLELVGDKQGLEPWSCERCTLWNPADHLVCSACASTRGVSKAEFPEPGTRACNHCTYGNDARAAICKMCHKSMDQTKPESYL
ncbi:uncharacterized protein LOC5500686 [Nematostella vectensis]|uniref:uncharacterized protein LOC5500686 n=1 Tax=Nematostella vectensis TaxID=45351 RepID=UPI0020773099|nr:uncharacterized protein LOC5500686 [Nematostella vectensis]